MAFLVRRATLVGALAISLVGLTYAQGDVNRPIRLIVPFQPGGGQGNEAIVGTAQEFSAFIKSENEKWSTVIKKLGITL